MKKIVFILIGLFLLVIPISFAGFNNIYNLTLYETNGTTNYLMRLAGSNGYREAGFNLTQQAIICAYSDCRDVRLIDNSTGITIPSFVYYDGTTATLIAYVNISANAQKTFLIKTHNFNLTTLSNLVSYDTSNLSAINSSSSTNINDINSSFNITGMWDNLNFSYTVSGGCFSQMDWNNGSNKTQYVASATDYITRARGALCLRRDSTTEGWNIGSNITPSLIYNNSVEIRLDFNDTTGNLTMLFGYQGDIILIPKMNGTAANKLIYYNSFFPNENTVGYGFDGNNLNNTILNSAGKTSAGYLGVHWLNINNSYFAMTLRNSTTVYGYDQQSSAPSSLTVGFGGAGVDGFTPAISNGINSTLFFRASHVINSLHQDIEKFYKSVRTPPTVNFSTIQQTTSQISISVYSSINNTFLKNFSVFIKDNNSDMSQNLTANNVGNVTINLANGTYITTIQAPQHSLYITTILAQSNNTYQNLTFTLGGLNALNISIWDENTNTLLLKNTTVQFISTSYTINKTTDTGYMYVQDLLADNYRIRYSTNNYRMRDYYLTILNGTNSSIKLFLLSTTNGTLTTFTITDQNANPAINFTVKGQRYYQSSNSYEQVVMAKTDAQGQAILDLEQSSPFYKFLITDDFGRIYLDTVPAAIFTNAYSLKISTRGDSFKDLRNANMIFENISFSNVTNSITFVYNDQFGLATDVCLFVNEISLRKGTVEVCNTCSTSSSATLICDVTSSINKNTTIVAKAFTNADNSTAIYLAELVITPQLKIQEVLDIFGLTGILLGLIITITMTMMGIWEPRVAMVFGTIGFVGSYMFGLITLGAGSLEWIIGIVLLGGILLYRGR